MSVLTICLILYNLLFNELNEDCRLFMWLLFILCSRSLEVDNSVLEKKECVRNYFTKIDAMAISSCCSNSVLFSLYAYYYKPNTRALLVL